MLKTDQLFDIPSMPHLCSKPEKNYVLCVSFLELISSQQLIASVLSEPFSLGMFDMCSKKELTYLFLLMALAKPASAPLSAERSSLILNADSPSTSVVRINSNSDMYSCVHKCEVTDTNFGHECTYSKTIVVCNQKRNLLIFLLGFLGYGLVLVFSTRPTGFITSINTFVIIGYEEGLVERYKEGLPTRRGWWTGGGLQKEWSVCMVDLFCLLRVANKNNCWS